MLKCHLQHPCKDLSLDLDQIDLIIMGFCSALNLKVGYMA